MPRGSNSGAKDFQVKNMPNLEHISPVMSQCATFEGLRQNPFRIFGLRVDLNSKELTEAIKDLSIQIEFGTELSHAFALGTIESNTMVQANQRLRDPVQRICDECFWFWPMDIGTNDVALDLIANGDKVGAKAAWKEFIGHAEWGPIASHNLAILDLYESFDDSTELDGLGTNAKAFLLNSVCINRIKARLRTIDDPRLPRNCASSILEEMRCAMTSNQIRIGLERISQGDTVRGRRNIRCAGIIADNKELLGSIAETELGSEIRRLETKNKLNIESATNDEWKNLAQEALKVIERMQHFSVLESQSQIVGNNTARVLRSISIHLYNEKNNRKQALEVAELARVLASGDLLQKINDEIVTVKEGVEFEQANAFFEPINTRIENLDNSSNYNSMAMVGQSILRDINSAVSAGHSKQRAEVLYRNLGYVLRNKAIKVYNSLDDMSTARQLLNIANQVANDSENHGLSQSKLKYQLLIDLQTLNRNQTASMQASAGSCLVPLVAILCLTGAAGYAAPIAFHSVQNLITTLLS